MHRNAARKMQHELPTHLRLFTEQAGKILNEVDSAQRDALQELLDKIEGSVMNHPIIACNRYLNRFAEGVTVPQARHEIQQFSVFAIHFDIAVAKLVANAPTEEAYDERLKILLNEKGIPFKDGFDGELTGQWSPKTVHFTWLQNMGRGLGLKFEDLGKIWIGLPGTVQFVDAVMETFNDRDQSLASGASFAIENWAANALWAPWIAGMEKLNKSLDKKVNLGYLTYHFAEETHHSQSTLNELLGSFQEPWFNQEKFLQGAMTVLNNGPQAYYASQLASIPDKDESWPESAC
ncbi:MAG: hypothetical protein IFK94_15380 [Acidobacteria bacterium]|uniref:Uncharacterized protein n=1 Tax=Candidatus Polarisedimenticola svalbardensis TaxID=2886004 RepID=A0A8J6Y2V7_9BACT|nr:hypothetical protein [Candidatus Polarisedimenticola svalbardensis]